MGVEICDALTVRATSSDTTLIPAGAMVITKTDSAHQKLMKTFADQLSKWDIEDLAVWFSSQKSNLHVQR